MRIFIGWSGEIGRNVALILGRWLKALFPDIEISTPLDDIMPSWVFVLQDADELKTADYGLICVTKDSVQSSNLYFRAGALSANVDYFTSFLFDVVLSELDASLRAFQSVTDSKDDLWNFVLELASILNKNRTENSINPDNLKKMFDLIYPALREELDELHTSQKNTDRRESWSNEINRKLDAILYAVTSGESKSGANAYGETAQ